MCVSNAASAGMRYVGDDRIMLSNLLVHVRVEHARLGAEMRFQRVHLVILMNFWIGSSGDRIFQIAENARLGRDKPRRRPVSVPA